MGDGRLMDVRTLLNEPADGSNREVLPVSCDWLMIPSVACPMIRRDVMFKAPI